MILIADSGATKTDWRLISEKKEIGSIRTIGFNPYFTNTETINEELSKQLIPEIPVNKVQKIFFYGAGCSTKSKNKIIFNALVKYFRETEIHIEHDILGAARGLFGKKEGISCILGTGSNSCYYDGINTTEIMPSLGFIYGDEGSGAQLGKHLLEAYMKKKLPSDLQHKFDEKYHISLEDILTHTYTKPYPNRYLANFTDFYLENQDSEFLRTIEKNCFDSFISYFIMNYKLYQEKPIGFVGSVAYFFKDSLLKSLSIKGLHAVKIIKNPIEGLIDYHIKY